MQTVSKAIFLLFIFFNVIFYRDFTYIGIPFNGGKVFITEIVIFVVVLSLLFKIIVTYRVGMPKTDIVSLWPLWAFLIYSFIIAFAYSNYEDLLFTVREFASVYYAIFAIIVMLLFRNSRSLEKLVRVFLVSAIFSMILVFFRYLTGMGGETTTEGVLRYGNYETVGLLFLVSWLLTKPLQLNRISGFAKMFLLVAAISCIILLIQHRSATIALFVSIFIMIFGNFKIKNLLTVRRKVISTVLILVILSFPVVGLAGGELLTGTLDRLATLFSPHEDVNIGWRQAVWMHLLQSMEGFDYIFGVGWGKRLSPMYFAGLVYGEEEHIGIHNSLIFYFYHLGMVGVTLFLLLLGMVYIKSLTVARKIPHPEGRQVLALLATNVGILVFAMFNVVLEGPYMGSVFWIILGMLWVKTGQVKNSLQEVRYRKGMASGDL